jgi:hypothetical protein
MWESRWFVLAATDTGGGRRALVDVDYEVLACAADCRKAAFAGARRCGARSRPMISPYWLGYGDIDACPTPAFSRKLLPHRAGTPIEGRGIAVETGPTAR